VWTLHLKEICCHKITLANFQVIFNVNLKNEIENWKFTDFVPQVHCSVVQSVHIVSENYSFCLEIGNISTIVNMLNTKYN